MSLRSPLPPIPAPPHDPRSLLLAGWVGPDPRAGFRVRDLDHVSISPVSGALVLGPSLAVERRMTEPSGSFGGLRLPRNVAQATAGDLYLLDPHTAQLKRLAIGQRGFVTVPGFTRAVDRWPAEPTHLCDPHGIAIAGGELFVADSGHERVGRFALRGLLPRGALVLPRSERPKLSRPWYPVALAFASERRLYVADPRNRRIDQFDGNGRWCASLATEAPAWALAVDDLGRLHALLVDAERLEMVNAGFGTEWRFGDAKTGSPAARVLRQDQGGMIAVADAADVADFTPSALAVDERGRLHVPACERELVFDALGVAVEPESAKPRYPRQGVFNSEALDSRIDGCPWHRVELRGSLPDGCAVKVRTLTADVRLAPAELPDPQASNRWGTNQVATQLAAGRWDCLVTSPPGRYLWLCLELTGTGLKTPYLEALVVEYPRISLRRYLPAVFGEDPTSADFTDRFLAIFDTSLRSIEGQLDRLPALFDPLSAPSERRGGPVDFLTWIGTWIGITATNDWTPARRRRYLKQAGALFRLHGTPAGLRRLLLLFLGFDDACRACRDERPRRRCVPRPLNCAPPTATTAAEPPAVLLEHFRLRRWLFAGKGRLGDDSVLWGKRIVNRSQLSGAERDDDRSGNARIGESQLITTPDPLRDPLLVQSQRVSVFVPARVRDNPSLRRGLGRLLALETPAHVQCEVCYVEPRFRVGVQAMIGLDSVIARTPAGVWLKPGQPLGQATVLARSPDDPRRPAAQVGKVRIGNTELT